MSKPNIFLGTYATFNEIVLAAYRFIEYAYEDDPDSYDAEGIARRFGKKLDNGLWYFKPDEDDYETWKIIDSEYALV